MKNENATPTMKHDGQLSTPHGGLTLRDYFAAKALPMCMTADESARTVAEMAYSMADAMLSERNK